MENWVKLLKKAKIYFFFYCVFPFIIIYWKLCHRIAPEYARKHIFAPGCDLGKGGHKLEDKLDMSSYLTSFAVIQEFLEVSYG